MPARILIENYNPRWPERYREEAGRIAAALDGRALQLEHAGSTAVPGLPAKPIIDVILAVADSADEPAYAPDLESAGYALRVREPNWFQHRMFKSPGADVNLHVFSQGCPEIGRMLLFRDWLRVNAPDRDLYARTKLALAEQEWDRVQDYAEAKTAVVQEILVRARL